MDHVVTDMVTGAYTVGKAFVSLVMISTAIGFAGKLF